MMDSTWDSFTRMSVRTTMPNGSVWHIPFPYFMVKYAVESELYKTDPNESLHEAARDLTEEEDECLTKHCLTVPWSTVSRIIGTRLCKGLKTDITQEDWVNSKKELKTVSYKHKELGFNYVRCSEVFNGYIPGTLTIRKDYYNTCETAQDKKNEQTCKCSLAKTATEAFCIYSPTPFEVSIDSWLNDFEVLEWDPITKEMKEC